MTRLRLTARILPAHTQRRRFCIIIRHHDARGLAGHEA